MSGVSFSVAVRAFCPVERGGSGADPGPLVSITASVAVTATGTVHMHDCRSLGKAKPRRYTFAELTAAGVQRTCKTCRVDERVPLTKEQSAYATTATKEWRRTESIRQEAEQLRKRRTELKSRIERADDQLDSLTRGWDRERLPQGSWPPASTATTATGPCNELLRDTEPIAFCEAVAVAAYDADAGTLILRCPVDSDHDPFMLREQAKNLVAHGHPHRAARGFDLWLSWQADRSAAFAALEAIERQYADVLPLHPIPNCAVCGDPLQMHRTREEEIWFCPGVEGQRRHLVRRDKRDDPTSASRAVEYLVGHFLQSLRRPAYGQLWPFALSPTSQLGDESLNPDPELLERNHERLLTTIAVVDGAGLAADDADLEDMRRQCQQLLEAVETLQVDGSAYGVLEPAVAVGATPSKIQQWLLIETLTLGAEGPPKVTFTLDRPDVRERLEIAGLRHAISAAREWADQREQELHAREKHQP
ncbi:hypothetical protein [Nocardia fluminea]|uniref:Uncharacterized protein n=1 Tax=Nocardia fluminea TaxID=134984 RepID=A0A2N3VG44_9NOCA|nr:hypothetical protein [Nocardia fluminea]PKV80577.1 hypothetical protein ATK86_5008 [Nocardia fluminea]